MNELKIKKELEKKNRAEIAKLVKYYGINEPEYNDQLWLITLHVMLNEKQELPVIKNDSGSYITQEQVTGPKEYHVHDNGGRPFNVKVDVDGIHIYTYNVNNYDYDGDEPIYDILVHTILDYDGYWWGYDSSSYKMHGNSLLVKLSKKKYMYIGDKIYTFKTSDEIVDYISPVGNSDVPYPVAYGKNNVYFMRDHVYIPISLINTPVDHENAEDMYSEFYGHIPSKFAKSDVKNMIDFKIVHERLY